MERVSGAAALAEMIFNSTELPTLVGQVIDDGAGGMFVQAGYHLSLEEAEKIVVTVMRDMRKRIEENNHPCDSCDARLARLTAALAIFEADGLVPTGRAMERH